MNCLLKYSDVLPGSEILTRIIQLCRSVTRYQDPIVSSSSKSKVRERFFVRKREEQFQKEESWNNKLSKLVALQVELLNLTNVTLTSEPLHVVDIIDR